MNPDYQAERIRGKKQATSHCPGTREVATTPHFPETHSCPPFAECLSITVNDSRDASCDVTDTQGASLGTSQGEAKTPCDSESSGIASYVRFCAANISKDSDNKCDLPQEISPSFNTINVIPILVHDFNKDSSPKHVLHNPPNPSNTDSNTRSQSPLGLRRFRSPQKQNTICSQVGNVDVLVYPQNHSSQTLIPASFTPTGYTHSKFRVLFHTKHEDNSSGPFYNSQERSFLKRSAAVKTNTVDGSRFCDPLNRQSNKTTHTNHTYSCGTANIRPSGSTQDRAKQSHLTTRTPHTALIACHKSRSVENIERSLHRRQITRRRSLFAQRTYSDRADSPKSRHSRSGVISSTEKVCTHRHRSTSCIAHAPSLSQRHRVITISERFSSVASSLATTCDSYHTALDSFLSDDLDIYYSASDLVASRTSVRSGNYLSGSSESFYSTKSNRSKPCDICQPSTCNLEHLDNENIQPHEFDIADDSGCYFLDRSESYCQAITGRPVVYLEPVDTPVLSPKQSDNIASNINQALPEQIADKQANRSLINRVCDSFSRVKSRVKAAGSPYLSPQLGITNRTDNHVTSTLFVESIEPVYTSTPRVKLKVCDNQTSEIEKSSEKQTIASSCGLKLNDYDLSIIESHSKSKEPSANQPTANDQNVHSNLVNNFLSPEADSGVFSYIDQKEVSLAHQSIPDTTDCIPYPDINIRKGLSYSPCDKSSDLSSSCSSTYSSDQSSVKNTTSPEVPVTPLPTIPNVAGSPTESRNYKQPHIEKSHRASPRHLPRFNLRRFQWSKSSTVSESSSEVGDKRRHNSESKPDTSGISVDVVGSSPSTNINLNENKILPDGALQSSGENSNINSNGLRWSPNSSAFSKIVSQKEDKSRSSIEGYNHLQDVISAEIPGLPRDITCDHVCSYNCFPSLIGSCRSCDQAKDTSRNNQTKNVKERNVNVNNNVVALKPLHVLTSFIKPQPQNHQDCIYQQSCCSTKTEKETHRNLSLYRQFKAARLKKEKRRDSGYTSVDNGNKSLETNSSFRSQRDHLCASPSVTGCAVQDSVIECTPEHILPRDPDIFNANHITSVLKGEFSNSARTTEQVVPEESEALKKEGNLKQVERRGHKESFLSVEWRPRAWLQRQRSAHDSSATSSERPSSGSSRSAQSACALSPRGFDHSDQTYELQHDNGAWLDLRGPISALYEPGESTDNDELLQVIAAEQHLSNMSASAPLPASSPGDTGQQQHTAGSAEQPEQTWQDGSGEVARERRGRKRSLGEMSRSESVHKWLQSLTQARCIYEKDGETDQQTVADFHQSESSERTDQNANFEDDLCLGAEAKLFGALEHRSVSEDLEGVSHDDVTHDTTVVDTQEVTEAEWPSTKTGQVTDREPASQPLTGNQSANLTSSQTKVQPIPSHSDSQKAYETSSQPLNPGVSAGVIPPLAAWQRRLQMKKADSFQSTDSHRSITRSAARGMGETGGVSAGVIPPLAAWQRRLQMMKADSFQSTDSHRSITRGEIDFKEMISLWRLGSVLRGPDLRLNVEELLRERDGDPETILTNLGFGSIDDAASAKARRIPRRFLNGSSAARGISLDLLVQANPDLRSALLTSGEECCSGSDTALHQLLGSTAGDLWVGQALVVSTAVAVHTSADHQPVPAAVESSAAYLLSQSSVLSTPPPPPPKTSSTPRTFFLSAARNVLLYNRFANIMDSCSSAAADSPVATVHEGVTATGTLYKSILHPDNTQYVSDQGLYDETLGADADGNTSPGKRRKPRKLLVNGHGHTLSPRVSPSLLYGHDNADSVSPEPATDADVPRRRRSLIQSSPQSVSKSGANSAVKELEQGGPDTSMDTLQVTASRVLVPASPSPDEWRVAHQKATAADIPVANSPVKTDTGLKSNSVRSEALQTDTNTHLQDKRSVKRGDDDFPHAIDWSTLASENSPNPVFAGDELDPSLLISALTSSSLQTKSKQLHGDSEATPRIIDLDTEGDSFLLIAGGHTVDAQARQKPSLFELLRMPSICESEGSERNIDAPHKPSHPPLPPRQLSLPVAPTLELSNESGISLGAPLQDDWSSPNMSQDQTLLRRVDSRSSTVDLGAIEQDADTGPPLPPPEALLPPQAGVLKHANTANSSERIVRPLATRPVPEGASMETRIETVEQQTAVQMNGNQNGPSNTTDMLKHQGTHSILKSSATRSSMEGSKKSQLKDKVHTKPPINPKSIERKLQLSLPKYSILDDDIDLAGPTKNVSHVPPSRIYAKHAALVESSKEGGDQAGGRRREGPVIRRREGLTVRPLGHIDRLGGGGRSRSTENLALLGQSGAEDSTLAGTSQRRSRRMRQNSWSRSRHFNESVDYANSDYDSPFTTNAPFGSMLNSYKSVENIRSMFCGGDDGDSLASGESAASSGSEYLDRLRRLKQEHQHKYHSQLDQLDQLAGQPPSPRPRSPLSLQDGVSPTSSEAAGYMQRLQALKSQYEESSAQISGGGWAARRASGSSNSSSASSGYLEKIAQMKQLHERKKSENMQRLQTERQEPVKQQVAFDDQAQDWQIRSRAEDVDFNKDTHLVDLTVSNNTDNTEFKQPVEVNKTSSFSQHVEQLIDTNKSSSSEATESFVPLEKGAGVAIFLDQSELSKDINANVSQHPGTADKITKKQPPLQPDVNDNREISGGRAPSAQVRPGLLGQQKGTEAMQSFEMEEIQSGDADVVSVDLPFIQTRHGGLARAGSAQSDSSGFDSSDSHSTSAPALNKDGIRSLKDGTQTSPLNITGSLPEDIVRLGGDSSLNIGDSSRPVGDISLLSGDCSRISSDDSYIRQDSDSSMCTLVETVPKNAKSSKSNSLRSETESQTIHTDNRHQELNFPNDKLQVDTGKDIDTVKADLQVPLALFYTKSVVNSGKLLVNIQADLEIGFKGTSPSHSSLTPTVTTENYVTLDNSNEFLGSQGSTSVIERQAAHVVLSAMQSAKQELKQIRPPSYTEVMSATEQTHNTNNNQSSHLWGRPETEDKNVDQNKNVTMEEDLFSDATKYPVPQYPKVRLAAKRKDLIDKHHTKHDESAFKKKRAVIFVDMLSEESKPERDTDIYQYKKDKEAKGSESRDDVIPRKEEAEPTDLVSTEEQLDVLGELEQLAEFPSTDEEQSGVMKHLIYDIREASQEKEDSPEPAGGLPSQASSTVEEYEVKEGVMVEAGAESDATPTTPVTRREALNNDEVQVEEAEIMAEVCTEQDDRRMRAEIRWMASLSQDEDSVEAESAPKSTKSTLSQLTDRIKSTLGGKSSKQSSEKVDKERKVKGGDKKDTKKLDSEQKNKSQDGVTGALQDSANLVFRATLAPFHRVYSHEDEAAASHDFDLPAQKAQNRRHLYPKEEQDVGVSRDRRKDRTNRKSLAEEVSDLSRDPNSQSDFSGEEVKEDTLNIDTVNDANKAKIGRHFRNPSFEFSAHELASTAQAISFHDDFPDIDDRRRSQNMMLDDLILGISFDHDKDTTLADLPGFHADPQRRSSLTDSGNVPVGTQYSQISQGEMEAENQHDDEEPRLSYSFDAPSTQSGDRSFRESGSLATRSTVSVDTMYCRPSLEEKCVGTDDEQTVTTQHTSAAYSKRIIVSKFSAPAPKPKIPLNHVSKVNLVIDNGEIKEVQRADSTSDEEGRTMSGEYESYAVPLYHWPYPLHAVPMHYPPPGYGSGYYPPHHAHPGLSGQFIRAQMSSADSSGLAGGGERARSSSCMDLRPEMVVADGQLCVAPWFQSVGDLQPHRYASHMSATSVAASDVSAHRLLHSVLRQTDYHHPELEEQMQSTQWPRFTRTHASNAQAQLEEVRLLQHALAKYCQEFRSLEVRARAAYTPHLEQLSSDEREALSSMEALRGDIALELTSLDTALSSRLHRLLTGPAPSPLSNTANQPDLAALSVIAQMIEVLKEQVYHSQTVTSLLQAPPCSAAQHPGTAALMDELSAATEQPAQAGTGLARTSSVQDQMSLLQHEYATAQQAHVSSVFSIQHALKQQALLLEEIRSSLLAETCQLRVKVQDTESQLHDLRRQVSSSAEQQSAASVPTADLVLLDSDLDQSTDT